MATSAFQKWMEVDGVESGSPMKKGDGLGSTRSFACVCVRACAWRVLSISEWLCGPLLRFRLGSRSMDRIWIAQSRLVGNASDLNSQRWMRDAAARSGSGHLRRQSQFGDGRARSDMRGRCGTMHWTSLGKMPGDTAAQAKHQARVIKYTQTN